MNNETGSIESDTYIAPSLEELFLNELVIFINPGVFFILPLFYNCLLVDYSIYFCGGDYSI